MNVNRFDAVLFDVDGTLIDSAPGIIHTMQETFAQMGTDISNVDLMQYLGPPLRKTFSEHYSSEENIERAVKIYRTSYQQKGCHECVLYPGVKEMLHTLQQAGVKLFTATSKPVVVVVPMLQELGIAQYFTEIGGASMDTERDTKTAVIESILARSDLNQKRILMVGDRQDDMQGARNCNLPAAAVTYGYGSKSELTPFQPCIMAANCEQLTSYILKGE